MIMIYYFSILFISFLKIKFNLYRLFLICKKNNWLFNKIKSLKFKFFVVRFLTA